MKRPIYGEYGVYNSSHRWTTSDAAHSAPAVWKLQKVNILLAAALGTPIHYSTMVIRTSALRVASSVFFEDDCFFDNDRMLAVALSLEGPILFRPYPEIFVRWHPAQENVSFSIGDQADFMSATTVWTVKTMQVSWNDLAILLLKQLAICPEKEVKTFNTAAMNRWCMPEISRHVDMALLPDEVAPVFRFVAEKTQDFDVVKSRGKPKSTANQTKGEPVLS